MLVFIFMVTKLDTKGKIYRTFPEKKPVILHNKIHCFHFSVFTLKIIYKGRLLIGFSAKTLVITKKLC